MLESREIPREEWKEYFDRFSRVHEGWLVALEVDEPGVAGGQAARNLPLEGIIADIRSGGEAIAIILDVEDSPQFTHSIAHSERVEVAFTDEGADESVTFIAQDGGRTRLRFRSALRPETVNGLPARR